MKAKRLDTIGAFALVSILVACGNSNDSTQGSGDEDERDAVTVGAIPVIDVAPLYLGAEEGIFERHGIDLEIELGQGGAAIVPAIVSGQYEFGFSNTVSLLVAREQGLPLKVVANGSRSTNTPGEDAVEVAAPDDSEIERPQDLSGKQVAINALENFGDITIQNSVEQDGGDPSSVQFVEVPYPDMPPLLANGEIDAAWTGEPFRTQILDQDSSIVASPLTDLAENMDLAYYFTSEEVLANDPELVERFAEALRASFEYAEEHEDETRSAIGNYAELPEGIAERVVLTRWPAGVNREGLNVLAEKAIEYEVLDGQPDLEALIHETAR